MFTFESKEIVDSFYRLWYALDGTQRCVDDPDLYVESWVGRPIPESEAEKLCDGCPFYQECQDYALLAGEEHGIWGGTTPEMRKRINGEE